MKILLLTSANNSLCQATHVALSAAGHEVAIELFLEEDSARAAIALFEPDLILCPMLKKRIPADIWQRHVCIILHPGIRGDRGASSLDWAILEAEQEWGLTALQAAEEMDAGDIWAWETFPTRAATKSSLYRNEVVEAGVRAALKSVERFESGSFRPTPLNYSDSEIRGRLRPTMGQDSRRIDWSTDSTAVILRKVRSADGAPGVLDQVMGEPFFVYGAWEEGRLGEILGKEACPGEIIAQRLGAICRKTVDGALWLTHLKRKSAEGRYCKLAATDALGALLPEVPEAPIDSLAAWDPHTWQEIWYREESGVGFLHFAFYNGAMSTEQCHRLLQAYRRAKERDTRVIVLAGGLDYFSNGIHLNVIEAADDPGEESWRNIVAIDDLVREILNTESHLTISAIHGSAGAGGVILGLAADYVVARDGVVLNPHYKKMGGLYGSEYWTYLLPRRVGDARALELTEACLPVGGVQAKEMGMVDQLVAESGEAFYAEVGKVAESLAADPTFGAHLARKLEKRRADESLKPLEAYRREELERMWQNFFGLDKSYHEARRRFVYKEAPTSSRVAWTRGQGVVTSPVLFGVGPDGEPLSRVSPA